MFIFYRYDCLYHIFYQIVHLNRFYSEKLYLMDRAENIFKQQKNALMLLLFYVTQRISVLLVTKI